MRISRIKLTQFKRFTDLEITNIPRTSKVVVLVGPNGCGKSSLFDALSLRYQLDTRRGWSGDASYYSKRSVDPEDVARSVAIWFHEGGAFRPEQFYVRSAYRNDPEFMLRTMNRMSDVTEELRFRRMIEQDSAVSHNYQRLASQAVEAIFQDENELTTIREFRERITGALRESMVRLFPGLLLNSLGSPLENGTFKFDKGDASRFDYKNLSGGEKAAFDLILDIIVKRASFPEAVYCIDEPEAHISTRLQADLLGELCRLVPAGAQLWIATHSIGMMRKAKELYHQDPSSISFLDLEGHDFDRAVVLEPVTLNRALWKRVLRVALDDLADLIAPSEIVICEGDPAGSRPGKNAEHDAICYNQIFELEFPDTKFIAGGNSNEVAADRLGFLTAIPMLADSVKVRRLIDRDDHPYTEIAEFARQGTAVLSRRNIEAYLYDDEVLRSLCESVQKPEEVEKLLADKSGALQASADRGNPSDDLKSAAGEIYNSAKRRLGLVAMGNDQRSFARRTLAPLIKPGMNVYAELRRDIFTG